MLYTTTTTRTLWLRSALLRVNLVSLTTVVSAFYIVNHNTPVPPFLHNSLSPRRSSRRIAPHFGALQIDSLATVTRAWSRSFSSSFPLSSSLASAASTGGNELTRWEEMYTKGGEERLGGKDGDTFDSKPSEIRVVSFDLDNCLWKTSETIAAANDALAAFLEERQIRQTQRVETIMGTLFQADKARYCPVETAQASAPVLLTLLRKDAIAKVAMDDNGYDEDAAATLADEAFVVWTRARHETIPAHLATRVVECLAQVKALKSAGGDDDDDDAQPVLICAITDGNSDPRTIAELEGIFEFCMNAEMVGVTKPNKRGYLMAARKALAHPYLRDLTGSLSLDSATDDEIAGFLGPWWVHIGDDFVKDIVAAKTLNLRTVWARELVLKKLRKKATTASEAAAPMTSGTVEELVQKVAAEPVIKMQIGATDYLADSMQHEFADAVVDNFFDIATVLGDWQAQAQATRSSTSQAPEAAEVPAAAEMPKAAEVPAAADPDNEADVTTATKAPRESKFCVFCGETLPLAAQFCSGCGEKQPNFLTRH